jgi:hypothetical protein
MVTSYLNDACFRAMSFLSRRRVPVRPLETDSGHFCLVRHRQVSTLSWYSLYGVRGRKADFG